MKVGLVVRDITHKGGAEHYARQLAGRLLVSGIDVTLLTRKYSNEVLESIQSAHPNSSLSVQHVPGINIDSVSSTLSFALMSAKVATELRRSGNVDLVQSFERTWCQDIVRLGHGCHREYLVKRRQHVPLWKQAWLHVSPLHQIIAEAERRMVKTSKFLIVNSQCVKRELQKHYEVDPDRIRVIYNGVDQHRFSPAHSGKRAELRSLLGLPQDRPIVLLVGSGFARKGVGFVINALNHLRESDPLIIVVGKGSRIHYQLKARVKSLGESLRFVGPQKNIEQWYQAADAFVLPSMYDPFSNAVLEAMATGIPIVIPEHCGGAEFINPTLNGHAVNSPEDPLELAEAIEHSLALPHEAVRSYNQQFMSELTWECNAQKTIDLYAETLELSSLSSFQ